MTQRHTNELPHINDVKLHTILNATPECIKIVAPDGSLTFMNQAGLNMVEAPSFNTIEGACIFDVISPGCITAWVDHHNRAVYVMSGSILDTACSDNDEKNCNGYYAGRQRNQRLCRWR